MADEQGILERVESAIARGEAWRAKEILRGNIGSRGYSPRLYERYGRLLLDLGEKYEAGKYLFLSAQRCADYEGAISLYLDRVKRSSPRAIMVSFPSGARLEGLDGYPEPLRSELRALHVPGKAWAGKRPTPPNAGPRAHMTIGCVVLALFLAFLAVAVWHALR